MDSVYYVQACDNSKYRRGGMNLGATHCEEKLNEAGDVMIKKKKHRVLIYNILRKTFKNVINGCNP